MLAAADDGFGRHDLLAILLAHGSSDSPIAEGWSPRPRQLPLRQDGRGSRVEGERAAEVQMRIAFLPAAVTARGSTR
jgi:hypothetical protein